jgi:hypothetical protein
MAAEVVGRAVLPAREGWWPTWVRRLLRVPRKRPRSPAVHGAPRVTPMASGMTVGDVVTMTHDLSVLSGPISNT